MSSLIPAERHQVYKDHGLEELLEEPEPSTDPDRVRIVDERVDSFGNMILLVWVANENSIHLQWNGHHLTDVPSNRGNTAINHTYPFLAAKMGEQVVDDLVGGRSEPIYEEAA